MRTTREKVTVGERRRTTRKSARTGIDDPRPVEWDLRLYVADSTPASVAAATSLEKLCEEHLPGRYHIELIDVIANPQIACRDDIVAIPTLIRKRPLPVKITIGNLGNPARVCAGLGIPLTTGVNGD